MRTRMNDRIFFVLNILLSSGEVLKNYFQAGVESHPALVVKRVMIPVEI